MKSDTAELTIFLLCHNRPKLAREAIHSILNQTRKDFVFIISDNSTDRLTEMIVKKEFPSVIYQRQSPVLTPQDHFKKIFQSSTTKYFVVFHDDDILDSHYVEKIYEAFHIKYSDACAIGVNGTYVVEGHLDRSKRNNTQIITSHKNYAVPLTTDRLLNAYLSQDEGGAAPFSAYAYNSHRLNGLFPDFSKGRLYFDTIFLASISTKNKIYWLPMPLVYIRQHDAALSQTCGVLEYKAFFNVVLNEYPSLINKLHLGLYLFVRRTVYFSKKKRFSGKFLLYLLTRTPIYLIKSQWLRSSILKKLFVRRARFYPPVE